MNTVIINGNRWNKEKGTEGQDIYTALQLIEEEKILGRYADKESYDILIEKDTDLYFPPDVDLHKKNNSTDYSNENKVAFKFRKISIFDLLMLFVKYSFLINSLLHCHNGFQSIPIHPSSSTCLISFACLSR